MDAGTWVRSLHLAAMAVVVGGSALCLWSLARRAPGLEALLRGYEWLFWGAVGASVASGVGNVGSMAAALPGPDSRWGAALLAKLLLALVALPVGLLRTLLAWGPLGPDAAARPFGAEAGPGAIPPAAGTGADASAVAAGARDGEPLPGAAGTSGPAIAATPSGPAGAAATASGQAHLGAEARGPTGRARAALLALHAATLAGALAAIVLAAVMAHGG